MAIVGLSVMQVRTVGATRSSTSLSGVSGMLDRLDVVLFDPVARVRHLTIVRAFSSSRRKEAVIQLRTLRPHSQYPSFPRKREPRDLSRLPLGPRFRGDDGLSWPQDFLTPSQCPDLW